MTTNPNTTITLDENQLLQMLATIQGRSVEDLRSLITAPERPSVAEQIAAFLPKLSERTRETYAVHLRRLLRGVPPVCDQACAPCLKRHYAEDPDHPGKRFEHYECTCRCHKCVDSRISIEPLGDAIVGPDVYTRELVEQLATVARRYAVKRGLGDNAKRAKRGLPPKRAEGRNAAETAINVMSALFKNAADHMSKANPALDVRKPKRNPKERRTLVPFELAELHYVTATGGDDPDLDLLRCRSLERGSRRRTLACRCCRCMRTRLGRRA